MKIYIKICFFEIKTNKFKKQSNITKHKKIKNK